MIGTYVYVIPCKQRRDAFCTCTNRTNGCTSTRGWAESGPRKGEKSVSRKVLYIFNVKCECIVHVLLRSQSNEPNAWSVVSDGFERKQNITSGNQSMVCTEKGSKSDRGVWKMQCFRMSPCYRRVWLMKISEIRLNVSTDFRHWTQCATVCTRRKKDWLSKRKLELMNKEKSCFSNAFELPLKNRKKRKEIKKKKKKITHLSMEIWSAETVCVQNWNCKSNRPKWRQTSRHTVLWFGWDRRFGQHQFEPWIRSRLTCEKKRICINQAKIETVDGQANAGYLLLSSKKNRLFKASRNSTSRPLA